MKVPLAPCLALPCVLVLTGCLSCAVDAAVLSVWGSDAAPPTLLSVTPRSSTLVSVAFSGPVRVLDASAASEGGQDLGARWAEGETASVEFSLSSALPAGGRGLIEGTVADGAGSTLSFTVPFTGYNERPAVLRINEVRFDYSKPKVEFVEFLVLRGGNLGGITIENYRNAARPVTELPPCEVSAGDFVVWHLRSVEEGLVTELGAVDVSAGTDSNPQARDIWDDQTSAPLKGTNALLLRERRGGALQDALLAAETAFADWPSDAVSAAAREAETAGLWPGSSLGSAVNTDGTSPTRTLGRISAGEGGAGEWAVCPTGKCSPGGANWVP